MIDRISRKICVGCKACGDACPVGAISYEVDEEGYWYPKIDSERCVKCGLCDQVCPAFACHRSWSEGGTEPKVYKAYHKNEEIRYNSTSGALFFALANAFLRDGGCVVGCAFDDDYMGAHHEVAYTPDDLKRLMRSKYFQSDTEGIYRQVKQLLDDGRKVLFCGVPCQISALYGFLRKNYENLYTIDLICLGINSPLAYRKFLEELKEKYQSEIAEVHFKNKTHAWVCLSTKVTFKNGQTLVIDANEDPWVSAQINGWVYLRPSCSNCKYKVFPRMSDITIGDFWGLKYTEEEQKLGVSVVLVNTEKGAALLSAASDDLVMEERSMKEALGGNPALTETISPHPRRREAFRRLQTEPYSKVVWDILGRNKKVKPYRKLIRAVKRRIKKILK